jgi:hypothetical protein
MRVLLPACILVASLLVLWLARGTQAPAEPAGLAMPSGTLDQSAPDAPALPQVPRQPAAAQPEETPKPAPPAPATEAEPYSEPEGAAWHDLATRAAPGALRARVLRGNRAVEGARVALFDLPAAGAWSLGATTAPRHEAECDSNGEVAFEVGVGSYLLRARAGDDVVTSPTIEFDPVHARTVLLPFGSSTLVVHVHEGGLPVPGIVAHLYGLGPEPARFVRRATDSAGRIEFGALIAGRYGVALQRAENRAPDDERLVWLDVAERVELRFGDPEPRVEWKAGLVDTSGAAVPGSRMFRFEHATRRDTLRRWTDAEGRFEVALLPGQWLVKEGDLPVHPRAEAAPIGTYTVEHGRTPGDVVLDGIVLRVALVPEAAAGTVVTSTPALPVDPELQLVLDELGHGNATVRTLEPEQLVNGERQWKRLPLGRYALRCTHPGHSLDRGPVDLARPVTLESPGTTQLSVTVARVE